MYKILYSKKAEKDLSKLSKKDIEDVVKKIDKLTFPLPLNLNIKKLTKAPGFYRLRVAKKRVIFELDHENREFWIRKIGFRKDIYR